MQFVVTQGHLAHWNRLVQLTLHLYGCPRRRLAPFCASLCPNCTFTSAIAIICRSRFCALPHTVPPVDRGALNAVVRFCPCAHILPLKVPHYAKLPFTNVPFGSLALKREEGVDKKSSSEVSRLLKFGEKLRVQFIWLRAVLRCHTKHR